MEVFSDNLMPSCIHTPIFQADCIQITEQIFMLYGTH